ncbi:hypothetical protein ROZALSC1DRAFT_30432 [Rozella allomycis CSF55]|uniref:Uncharacterized protein n=1 Tax=Rozella allomycis (strain CSF55) TaxID=988480 RepID=A0A4P9YGM5_ROZAC|nr:hypothetical protein ROZALSC1DRAFT_30432 [Rozella allomycis CSF55]
MINDLRKAIFRLALAKRYYSNGILDSKVLDSNMNMIQQKLLDSNMRFEHGIELISKSKNIGSEVLVEFVKRHKTHPKLLADFLPMLDGFKHKYNANFLNLLIGQAAVRNLKEDVLRVYMKYDELNIARDHYTYTKLVSYASRTNDLELCKLLYNELMNLSNPKLEPILYLLLMEVFASRDKWEEVEELHKFIKDCDRNLDYANILMNAVFASDNIMTKYYNLYWQNVKKENFNLMIILLKRFRATNNRPLFFKTFEKAKEHKFAIPCNVYAHCLHLFGETDKLFNYYLEIREDPKIQPLFFSTVIKCVAETKRYEMIDYLCKDFRRRNDLLADSHVKKALEILSSDKNVTLPADIAQNTDADLDTEIFNLLNETEEDKDMDSALSKFYHMLKNGKIPNKTSCVLLLSHLSRYPEKHAEFKKIKNMIIHLLSM